MFNYTLLYVVFNLNKYVCHFKFVIFWLNFLEECDSGLISEYNNSDLKIIVQMFKKSFKFN